MKRILIIAFTLLSLNTFAQLPSVKPGSTEFRFPNTGNMVDTFATKADVRAGGGTGATLYSTTGSNTDGAINQAANTTLLGAKPDTSNVTQTADYVIEKVGSTYYARPTFKSGLPLYSNTDFYTVFQDAITQLHDSGSIKINKGNYYLTDEPVISGLGSGFHTLRIRGDGWSTVINQNTSGKNGLVINNRAGVVIEDLKISCGSSAKSAIDLDTTGATSEVSVNQSIFNNLHLIASNPSYPALFAKNFWFSTFDNIYAVNLSGDAIILYNGSGAGTNYGNSKFGKITVDHSASTGYAGLKFLSGGTNSRGVIDATSLDYYFDVNGGDYSIYSEGSFLITFNNIDIENAHRSIALGMNGGTTQAFEVLTGTVISVSGDTAIMIHGAFSGGNKFHMKVIGDATTIPVYDALVANADAPNYYDLWLGQNVDPTKINILWSSQTPLFLRSKETGSKTVMGAASIEQLQAYNDNTLGLQAMGSGIKSQALVLDDIARATSLFSLVSQKSSWFAIYIPKSTTLTGVATIIKTAGVYTAGTYNGVGLYSASSGTLTEVASSTDNSTLWTASPGYLKIPFSSTYTASPGLYYVCLLYQSSAETTAPALAAAGSLSLGAYTADFTNGNVLYGIKNSVTTLPSTQALSGVTASAAAMWVALY